MRRIRIVFAATAVLVLYGYVVGSEQTAQTPAPQSPVDLPLWAYGWGASVLRTSPAPPADDDELVRIPGSKLTLKRSQFRRLRGDEGVKEVPDWAPDDHAPMPDIVKFGRSVTDSNGELMPGEDGGIRACGVCHSATGQGRPENAAPAGLPLAYILQQLEDLRNGTRVTADPRKENAFRMASFAKLMTPRETRAAAEYFASLPYPQLVKVVETDTVPKTRAAGGMFEVLEGADAGTEPIGDRIIEVPEYPELTAVRAPNAGYLAYVPVGSVKKGESLVARGQCASCHGRNLGGNAPGAPQTSDGYLVPPLAGRSPSYLVRQLYDLQVGTRRGAMSGFMQPVVADLTASDMLSIAAYASSLVPPPRDPAFMQSASR